MAHPFERQVVVAYNDFFEDNGIAGLAYRLKQSRFSLQVVDVLVDSPDQQYYLAIECKSINSRRYNKLYFSANFSGGIEQLHGHDMFCAQTGRTGLVAIELRNSRRNQAYLVPLWYVLDVAGSGRAGLDLEDIMRFPALVRDSGKYRMEAGVLIKERSSV
jgi:hypothetical protein